MVIDCVHTICLKAIPHEVSTLEHLDFAIKESYDKKMQLLVERVLRHKKILEAQVLTSESSGINQPACVDDILLALVTGP